MALQSISGEPNVHLIKAFGIQIVFTDHTNDSQGYIGLVSIKKCII